MSAFYFHSIPHSQGRTVRVTCQEAFMVVGGVLNPGADLPLVHIPAILVDAYNGYLPMSASCGVVTLGRDGMDYCGDALSPGESVIVSFNDGGDLSHIVLATRSQHLPTFTLEDLDN